MQTAPLVSAEPPSSLVAARVVLDGEELIVFRFTAPLPALPASLSSSEREVVQGALEGRTNAQIARERGTSARTIANQIASAFRKLGVRSRGELAARVTGT